MRKAGAFSIVFICVFTFTVGDVSASHTNRAVEQDTETLGENIGIYALTFGFAAGSEDFYIPVTTERGLKNKSGEAKIGYVFQESGDETSDGVSGAILLAPGLEAVDGMYRIPAGTTAGLSFIAVFGVTQNESGLYRLQMTEFPFYVGNEREQRQLNVSEMKYHNTNYVGLNYQYDPE